MCLDLLDVVAIKAVYVDKHGKQHHTDCISVDVSSLALESPATVGDRAKKLSAEAKARFDAKLQFLSQDDNVCVKGVPDDSVALADVFSVTFGRAFTACALNIMRNKDIAEVGKVNAAALHCKGNTASITLSCLASDKVSNRKRGPSAQDISAQVRLCTRSTLAANCIS